MDTLTVTYSLADQNFSQTKSIGIFNVSTQLLENLARRDRLTSLSVLSNSTLRGKLQLPQETVVSYHDEAIKGKFGRAFWDQWGVYEAAERSANRWLFLPKGFASFLRRPAFKLAVYIYDTVHDFYRTNYPRVMPWIENRYFIKSLKETLKYSDIIFTDSDFANDELKRLAHHFMIDPPIIITAGIGFTRAKGKEAVPQKRDSLLLLTSKWPHKLTGRAVTFIERWQRETGFSGNVELVGSLPSGIRLPRMDGWRHLSRLSETVYRQSLAESKALLFFSAYEGFGMPPVEAIIAGTCPVFSDIPVTREVMGGAGFSFSNDSYESFAEALDKAMSIPEEGIRLWADRLLMRHSWDKVVERIADGLAMADEQQRIYK